MQRRGRLTCASMKNHLTYKDAGVDIDRGNALVSAIGPLAARTRRPEVRTSIGGFGALFDVPTERYKKPVLVSGTDGVGTKIRLALDHDHLDGIGAHPQKVAGIEVEADDVADLAMQAQEARQVVDQLVAMHLQA